ncbi:MAG: hypothetical protein COB24_08995 [Hyphomicrobiales bacterium]|nr:MAG: hypothetical protein COB24_08995 [Hyphomicrobiales bacterium]
MTLGKRIKHHRAAKGLTQKQVADYLNLTKNAITAWEKDRSAPSVGNMRLLVEILDITVADLMDASDSFPEIINNTTPTKPKNLNHKPSRLRIPIRGYAQGDYISTGNAVKKPIGFIDLAPSFSNIVDLYAVYITGNSMSPAHNHGDTRLVSPHTPYKIGDTVVIVKKASSDEPETSYIKIFDKIETMKNGQMSLTFSDHDENQTVMICNQKNLEFVHKVLTYNELLGL